MKITKKNLQKLIREETAKVLSEDNLTESVAWQEQTTKRIKTLDTLLRQVLRILRSGGNTGTSASKSEFDKFMGLDGVQK